MRSIDKIMFYRASPNTFEKAKILRQSMTDAEKILWEKLRDRTIFRTKFRRQHPVDIFIVDFYCHEFKLAIELDGKIHMNKDVKEYDEGRSHDIEKFGIKILRFKNEEVSNNLDRVIETIQKNLTNVS